MRFRGTRAGGAKADVSAVEADVLAQCAHDLLDLLGEPDDAADPLESLVGLTSRPVERPDDPALQRLLPDAYPDDLPGAAAEFRRYTESDLRARKRLDAGMVLATLPAGGGRLVLDREQCDAWLGCLNDLRLVLGTRLQVTEDLDPDDVPEDDPRFPALQVYSWLGWLQETLVACLTPRRPGRRP